MVGNPPSKYDPQQANLDLGIVSVPQIDCLQIMQLIDKIIDQCQSVEVDKGKSSLEEGANETSNEDGGQTDPLHHLSHIFRGHTSTKNSQMN
mmetsp:Transcript_31988/g.48969  ORF Transcript_31988/g.48969 Transcript_31988/m.48969 type:complete len:92 (-) Transcript_31988:160-435(-)